MDSPTPDPETWVPRALLILSLLFAVMTAYVHLDPGRAAAASSPSAAALRGRDAWRRHNCQACHQLYGLGGFLGPDLTNASRRLDADTLAGVASQGRGFMPKLLVSREEAVDITEYLRYVDQTGRFPTVGWPPESLPN